MTWFDFWLAFAAAVALMIAPGVALLSPVGLSWGNRVVFAPVASAAAVAVLGIAYGLVGLHFNPLTFLLGTAVIAAVAYAARRFWLRRLLPAQGPAWGRAEWIALVGGVLVAGVGWLIQFVHNIVPNAVSKTYDAPWHLSIIRHILDTGNASTLKAGIVDPTVGSYFYPASWHGLVALVARASPADVPTAVNATVLAVMAVAWPLSLVAFTRTVLRANASTTVVTAVLSCAFVAFPARFDTYGILYANQYGYALLPALLAAAVLLFRTDTTLLARLLLLGTAFVGAAVAQPNSVFTAWLLLMPFAIGVVHRWARDHGAGRQVGRAALVSAGFVTLAAIVWLGVEHSGLMRRTLDVDWTPFESVWRAVWDVLTLGLMHKDPGYLMAGFVLAGGVIAWFKARWLVGAYVLACGCYVVNAGFFFGNHLTWFRKYATGYWYHDSWRLAAATVLIAVPLAVLAVTCLADLIAKVAQGRVPARVLGAAAGLLSVVVMAGALAGPDIAQQDNALRAYSPMRAAGQSPTFAINQDKVEFMAKVRSIIGSAPVANDPFDGSAYGYGLVGLNTFYKSYIGNWMGTPSADQDVIRNSLSSLDPEVCAALHRENIRYVMLMGRTGRDIFSVPFDFHINGSRPGWDGVNVVGFRGFQVMVSEPSTGRTLYQLYRITGC